MAVLFRGDRYDSDPGMPDRIAISGWVHWNLWTRRMMPYQQLSDGDPITLVETWPGGGRLTWEVAADNVFKLEYSTKDQAVRAIATRMKLPRAQVRNNDYTVNGPDQGYVLAWEAKPLRPLDLLKPSDLKLQRHGWLRENDLSRLASWGLSPAGLTVPAQRGGKKVHGHAGQGRRLSPAENRAVEARAIEMAEQWCRKGRMVFTDVHATRSWDLEARPGPGGTVVFIEVKGTTGSRPEVEMTDAELKHARMYPANTALLVATDIVLDRSTTPPTASGGKLHERYPWDPQSSQIAPIRYRVTL